MIDIVKGKMKSTPYNQYGELLDFSKDRTSKIIEPVPSTTNFCPICIWATSNQRPTRIYGQTFDLTLLLISSMRLTIQILHWVPRHSMMVNLRHRVLSKSNLSEEAWFWMTWLMTLASLGFLYFVLFRIIGCWETVTHHNS